MRLDMYVGLRMGFFIPTTMWAEQTSSDGSLTCPVLRRVTGGTDPAEGKNNGAYDCMNAAFWNNKRYRSGEAG